MTLGRAGKPALLFVGAIRNSLKKAAFLSSTPLRRVVMTDTLPRRLVVVTAPDPLAALGEILRRAFGRPARLEMFDRLVGRLDRD
jgi:hypothetical protein